jgi:uncharacterized protein (TIGR02145 family)
MNKLISSTIAMAVCSSLYGQTILVANGWQLVGATEDITNMAVFTSDCVNTVWTYDNGWKSYSGDSSMLATLQSLFGESNIITGISKAEGFWINSNNTDGCTVDTNEVDGEDNTTSSGIPVAEYDVDKSGDYSEGDKIYFQLTDTNLTISEVTIDEVSLLSPDGTSALDLGTGATIEAIDDSNSSLNTILTGLSFGDIYKDSSIANTFVVTFGAATTAEYNATINLDNTNITNLDYQVSFPLLLDGEDPFDDNESTEITFNGKTYGTVISPYTGKIWLDRNLGADQVCTAINDELCYGDYYQWGRQADGHEESDGSSTTSSLATDISNAGTTLPIIPTAGTGDWAVINTDNDGSLRNAQWSKTDGSSICPEGFRVPTKEEYEAEFDISGLDGSSTDYAFELFLKIPRAGGFFESGNFYSSTSTVINLWTATPGFDIGSSFYFQFGKWFASSGNDSGNQSFRFSVRCIKAD